MSRPRWLKSAERTEGDMILGLTDFHYVAVAAKFTSSDKGT